ncbi:hypothetical protein LS48_02035 [Aequorivita aquimaris]|uniref:Uncharacterized protein n=1 Tax=Aequorivita aquimaris TaxID=1548749 RepID=A0A137RM65_9FLAO|nr:hypothetical protein LS48_02035 [Aequorivita aquimaris]
MDGWIVEFLDSWIFAWLDTWKSKLNIVLATKTVNWGNYWDGIKKPGQYTPAVGYLKHYWH